MGRPRSRTLAITSLIVLFLLILAYFVPIKSRSFVYCKLNKSVKAHYSWVKGDSSRFNSDEVFRDIDSSGLQCAASTPEVIRLYVL
jgi:hypothetical protein